MSRESELIELFGRRSFDLATIAAGATETLTVARHVDVAGYGQAVVLLRVHANAMGSLRTATLRCVSEAPTADDPKQDFLLGSSAMSSTVDTSTTAGTLLKAGLTPDFSYALRFLIDLFNGSGSSTGGGTVDLSADLLVRRGVTRPGTYKHTFAYGPPDAAGYYVPFATVTESSIIGVRQTLIVPHAGRVDRVTMWCDAGGGTTTVSFHRNGSTTASSSVTKTFPTSTVTEFRFPPTARFDPGDRIHIKVTPSTTPGAINGTLALELDNDFLPTS